MSVGFLAFLGRRLGGSATLLAVSVRAEGLPDAPLLRRTLDELSNEAHLAWTEVRPLSEADTRRLVQRAAAPDASADAEERLAAQAWRLGEGNPFVVLEAMRVWCAQGAPALDGLSLPERVSRSIVDRLERLDARTAQLVSVAAVTGPRLRVGPPLPGEGPGGPDEEAVACYSEALDIWRQASSRREIDVARVDVQVELGSALHAVGDVERALDHYRSAEAGAVALGDRGRAAWIIAAMSYAHTSLGQHRTAIELAHRALEVPGGGADNPALRIWVQQSLVRTAYAVGDYQAAVSVARATLETLADHPADEPFGPALLTPVVLSVGVRGFLALALSSRGLFNDALAEGAETVRVAEKVNRSPELAWANYCLGRTVLEQGNADQAVEYLERALALTRDWEPATPEPRTGRHPLADLTAATLALAHAATGQLASAISLAVAGATGSKQLGFVRLLQIQGSVLLAAQRFDEATSVAIVALETARGRGERAHEAWALGLLGAIARRRQPGSVERAVGHFDGALALADQLDLRPLRARCRLERAEALDHAGRHDETGQSLGLAIEDFRAMEMTAWLHRAKALEEALTART